MTSNDLDRKPDTEASPSGHRDAHSQSKTFVMLEENNGADYDVEFPASSGWYFKRFKSHYSLHNVNVSGESASADVKVEEFSGILDKLVVEENYSLEQIVNTDETFLFWKWKPERTFTHKEAN